jgi:hypothetical protein
MDRLFGPGDDTIENSMTQAAWEQRQSTHDAAVRPSGLIRKNVADVMEKATRISD